MNLKNLTSKIDKERSRLYYEKNKDRIKERSRLYYEKNKEKILSNKKGKRNDYQKEYRIINIEKEIERNRLYYEKNKEVINKKYRIKYNENKDFYIEKSKKYQKENPQKRILNHKKRMKDDNLYRISTNIRKNIWNSFKNKKYTKKSRTHEILGCDYELFEFYIELQFDTWMNWDNYGKYNGELNFGWDLDHIIPISSAKTEEEITKLNHYTNFQPLCSKVNRDIKKDKI